MRAPSLKQEFLFDSSNVCRGLLVLVYFRLIRSRCGPTGDTLQVWARFMATWTSTQEETVWVEGVFKFLFLLSAARGQQLLDERFSSNELLFIFKKKKVNPSVFVFFFPLQWVNVKKLQGTTMNVSTEHGSLKVKAIYAESNSVSSCSGPVELGHVHGELCPPRTSKHPDL